MIQIGKKILWFRNMQEKLTFCFNCLDLYHAQSFSQYLSLVFPQSVLKKFTISWSLALNLQNLYHVILWYIKIYNDYLLEKSGEHMEYFKSSQHWWHIKNFLVRKNIMLLLWVMSLKLSSWTETPGVKSWSRKVIL